MCICLYVCVCYATQADKASWLQIVLSYSLHLPPNSLSSPSQHARSLNPPTSLLSSPPYPPALFTLVLRQRSLVDVVVVAATVNFMRAHTLKKNAVRRAKRKWGGVRQRGAGNEAQAA